MLVAAKRLNRFQYTRLRIHKYHFKKVIPGKDIYINYASDLSKSQDEELISLLRDKGIDFVIEGDDLIVRKGSYRINEDLTFPSSKRVKLLPGVRFLLASEKSILIQSDLTAMGTSEEPIEVIRLKKSFGVFAVIGGQKAEVILSNFNIVEEANQH